MKLRIHITSFYFALFHEAKKLHSHSCFLVQISYNLNDVYTIKGYIDEWYTQIKILLFKNSVIFVHNAGI